MTDLLSTNIDVRHKCLDMFPIKWVAEGIEDQCSEDGILVEIWRTGGLVHTCVPIPEGSWVKLAPTGFPLQAQVTCCEQDDRYGFLVSVSVNQSQYDNWFPQSYCPPYLRDDDQKIEEFYPSENTLW